MNKKGFTLVELMILVAVVGILAAIAIPTVVELMGGNEKKAVMFDGKTVRCSSIVRERCGVRLRHCDDGNEYSCLTNVTTKQ